MGGYSSSGVTTEKKCADANKPRDFVYWIRDRNRVLKIGKSSVSSAAADFTDAAFEELWDRYENRGGWNAMSIEYPYTEFDAFTAEAIYLRGYQRSHGGKYPPWNERGGGAGRRRGS